MTRPGEAVPWFDTHYADALMLCWMSVVFIACVSLGIFVSLTAEVFVGCAALLLTWPLAQWALRREDSRIDNSQPTTQDDGGAS